MIPIFEYKDIFDGNNFKPSENPLINEFREAVENALISEKIIGCKIDDYSGEYEYIVKEINEYNKFYIFMFLAEKYPDYGFLDSENNLSFRGNLLTIQTKPTVLDITLKKIEVINMKKNKIKG